MQSNSDINDVGKTNGAYSNPPQQKKKIISLQKWPYWTDIEFCIFQLSPSSIVVKFLLEFMIIHIEREIAENINIDDDFSF